MAIHQSAAHAEAQPSRPSLSNSNIRAAVDCQLAQASLVKTALGHARMRDRWMRCARERRAVPFLADEVASCVRRAREENQALIRTLRSLAALQDGRKEARTTSG